MDLNLRDEKNGTLEVKMIKPITSISPILFRRYTLIPSDESKDLLLIIAPEYHIELINTEYKNGVYGQWVWAIDDIYILTLFVFLGDCSYELTKTKCIKFIDELPLYVTNIVNGDKAFYDANPNLKESYISMRFISSNGEFNKTVYYCKVKNFLID